MKTMLTSLCLVALLALPTSCTDPGKLLDYDITVLLDVTDGMAAYPTSGEIESQLNLKAQPWQSVRVSVTYVSDKDINDATAVTLEGGNEWTGNLPQRRATIERFRQQLASSLAVKANAKLPYSIVYRAVATAANELAASTAAKRWLIVASDLREHTPYLSFYDSQTLSRLQNEPQAIARQLEAIMPLKRLDGIQMWLLYDPANYGDSESYTRIANFYKGVFEAHGAVTHIANKFQPL